MTKEHAIIKLAELATRHLHDLLATKPQDSDNSARAYEQRRAIKAAQADLDAACAALDL